MADAQRGGDRLAFLLKNGSKMTYPANAPKKVIETPDYIPSMLLSATRVLKDSAVDEIVSNNQ